MTSNTEQEKKEKRRADDRRRKANQRAREKAAANAKANQFGAENVTLTFTHADRERLDDMRQKRAVAGEPYTREEYIAELIQQDAERYQAQVAALGCCGKCKSPLPAGCGDTFRGDGECWRTWQHKELML
ncbi:hypothetical protein [Enterovibrio norvegicus]|uniref:hypothetical protein n=1 Tax=Enterovibrio norvegicus TaxID=188144 RepID=UPI000C819E9D|nr:hypothetical protein [Enterovibrio norvegicus]